ncbi:hypothetical protein PF006_g30765 [Phytophthora fragariae]|uniref:Uncharacterized protein n=1 Tax=Phytophthora fragariae TaxID=53985 RepID=A0A6A3PNM3_9STRA|nr:hypothetical protein PF003_g26781 [Phytophthora fragariae]KAE9064164.1 hypothetical protein PF006_g30765 [Phytophthora fragariae]
MEPGSPPSKFGWMESDVEILNYSSPTDANPSALLEVRNSSRRVHRHNYPQFWAKFIQRPSQTGVIAKRTKMRTDLCVPAPAFSTSKPF